MVESGKQEPAGPPPPPGFEAYKKSEAAPGVLGMIQQIISDAKALGVAMRTLRPETSKKKKEWNMTGEAAP